MDFTDKTLGQLLSSDNETIRRNAMSILKQLQKLPIDEQERQMQSFNITSVCRADLEGEGFDTSKVDDMTMTRLASKMADAYCDTTFWIDLDVIAEYLEIPRKQA